jgi:hypothetical protein
MKERFQLFFVVYVVNCSMLSFWFRYLTNKNEMIVYCEHVITLAYISNKKIGSYAFLFLVI